MKGREQNTHCLFCRIAAREQPANVIYADDDVVAFRDMHPKYRVHLLVIPTAHLSGVQELEEEHDALAGKLLRVGAELARREGIADAGFRLLTNQGPDAGQVVDHLHLHVLGGEPLRGI